jgi:C4-dicarboxylate transporter DctM subunit
MPTETSPAQHALSELHADPTVIPGLRAGSRASALYSRTIWLFDLACVVLMVAMTVTTAVGVIWRYGFNDALTWTLEISSSLFVLLTFIGSVSASARGLPRLDFLERVLSGRAVDVVRGFSAACSIFFLVSLVVLGYGAVRDAFGLTLVTVDVPQAAIYAAIPIGALGMLITVLWQFVQPRITWVSLVSLAAGLAVLIACLYFLQLSHGALYGFMVVTFIAALASGAPIALAVGLAGMMLVAVGGIPTDVVPERMFSASNSVVLIAIPLFMLTGSLMSAGSMADRLVGFVTALVGRIRGGLGIANVGASMVFADISASAVADTAAIGSVMIPSMKRRGYPGPFAAALQSASGSLGLTLPPSSTMIVYAVTAGVSIADVFLASMLPGILVALSLCAYTYYYARKTNLPVEPHMDWNERRGHIRGGILPLLTPVIILGCIFSGITTTTEAGAVAVAYAFAVSVLFYRDLSLKGVYAALLEASVGTARVTLIVAGAFLLAFGMSAFRGVQEVSDALSQISTNPVMVLIIINLVLVVLHMFLEGLATILIVVPAILPFMTSIGIDPLVFGVILTQNTALGLLFPPLGLNLYIASAIANEPVSRVARAAIPFCIVLTVDILILIFFPGIVTIVPSLVGSL